MTNGAGKLPAPLVSVAGGPDHFFFSNHIRASRLSLRMN